MRLPVNKLVVADIRCEGAKAKVKSGIACKQRPHTQAHTQSEVKCMG